MHGSISAGAAKNLFWSYNGLSIAYVYENYAISNQYTFDHEVVILASPVLEKRTNFQVAHMFDAKHNRREHGENLPG